MLSPSSNNDGAREAVELRTTESVNEDGHAETQFAKISEVSVASAVEEIPDEEKEHRRNKLKAEDSGKMLSFPAVFTPRRLAQAAESKNLGVLEELGGIDGILTGLGTNGKHGISEPSIKGKGSLTFLASFEERRRVYGPNTLPARKTKSFLQLMWIAWKQILLILLSAAAVVALALGLFQDFGTPTETFTCGPDETCTRPQVNWVKGVAIIVAVVTVVLFSSVNDWQKERQFRELNEKKENRTVKVIRDGNETVINAKDLVVGEVALLDPGEITPCDGIFLSGSNVRCDESSITGESDAIKKITYAECLQAGNAGQQNTHADCFVISGSKVLEGIGTYVIIAVGERCLNGRIMMALRSDTENTPLQKKLDKLGRLIAMLASTACSILFAALLVRFFVQLGTGNPQRSASENGLEFVDALILSVSLFVIAVPEGLPLAVTLALALATRKMTAEDLLVRVLASCETMANASVICTDKTGTLTQNSMTVVAGAIGVQAKFVRHLKENSARAGVGGESGFEESTEQETNRQNDFAIDQIELGEASSPALRSCFNEAICINSTVFEDVDQMTGRRVFVGSKTETALLQFARDMGLPSYQSTRDSAEIVQIIPFSSERKAMGVVVRVRDGHWRLYLKGASEILAERSTKHVVVSRPGEGVRVRDSREIETREIDVATRDNMSRTITFYASQAFRTLALCYRDLESWPPKCLAAVTADEVAYEDLATDLTLIGIVAIEDPLRDGVADAVAQCRRAGVQVKMCTGDNVLTARSIASQCGIYTPGGLVMEGPAFRELDDRELLEVVPKLQVLARSSPEDKRVLVEKLKELGEIVAVTGDGTNDGPALKTAHVGFSMGLTGTEVAKEASDIVLMDDNFANIVKAIMWGRCVNEAIRKFLQCQLSANIAAVIVTYVTALSSSSQDASALTAVQLLWVNVVVNSCAAVALATDPASPSLLDRKPEKMNTSLFTVDMYKQILGQALYQATMVLIFHYLGDRIFGFSPDPNNEMVQIENDAQLRTLVFNAFVFAQVFNLINCRSIDSRKNIFAGIHRNLSFILVFLLETAIQITIVLVGGHAFSVTDIDGLFWGISLALGFMSIPIGFLLRCIPNAPVERFFYKIRLMRDPSVLPTERPNSGVNVSRNPIANLARKLVRTVRSRRSSVVLSRSNTLVGTAVIRTAPGKEVENSTDRSALDSSPVGPVRAGEIAQPGPNTEKDNAA